MGWGVYQLFPTASGRPIFIAVTANRHWKALCDVLQFDDWKDAPEFGSNRNRTKEKNRIAERITEAVKKLDYDDLAERRGRFAVAEEDGILDEGARAGPV